MAFDAFPLRHMPISLDNTEMTFFTGNPSGDILLVVEVPPFDLNIPLGLNMT
jgi:hypothetical protein